MKHDSLYTFISVVCRIIHTFLSVLCRIIPYSNYSELYCGVLYVCNNDKILC